MAKAMKVPQELAELGIKEVRLLRPEPGDVIILMAPEQLAREQVEEIRDHAEAFFAGHQVVVLKNGMSLEIVRKGGEPK